MGNGELKDIFDELWLVFVFFVWFRLIMVFCVIVRGYWLRYGRVGVIWI